jgi:hypothetical protein
VFIDDLKLKNLWDEPHRYYIVADHAQVPHLGDLLGTAKLTAVASTGGKTVLTNEPLGKE